MKQPILDILKLLVMYPVFENTPWAHYAVCVPGCDCEVVSQED